MNELRWTELFPMPQRTDYVEYMKMRTAQQQFWRHYEKKLKSESSEEDKVKAGSKAKKPKTRRPPQPSSPEVDL